VSGLSTRRRRRVAQREGDPRVRSFVCSDALFREFEARAADLDCSVDWLLSEAMQRLLAETRASARVAKAPLPAPVADAPSADDTLEDARALSAPPLPDPIALIVDGRRVVVDRDGFVIGRRDADLVIDHEGVSRRHVAFDASEDGWMAFDLGSTNGVMLNGNFVVGALVQPGDVISLGSVCIAVERA
jgi:hypothetical protein